MVKKCKGTLGEKRLVFHSVEVFVEAPKRIKRKQMVKMWQGILGKSLGSSFNESE